VSHQENAKEFVCDCVCIMRAFVCMCVSVRNPLQKVKEGSCVFLCSSVIVCVCGGVGG